MKTLVQRWNSSPVWAARWKVKGFSVFAPTLDRSLYLALHKFGLAGSGEARLLERLVSRGDRVLDIGANVGLYTALLSRCVGPAGSVLAFEPMPVLADAVQRLVAWNNLGNVSLFPFALGDADGVVQMSTQAFNSGDNRIGPSGNVAVPVRRGDELIECPAVEFVKIDVQGYELRALRGLTGLLRRSPRARIFFEYWPRGMQLAGDDPAELPVFLDGLGFRLMYINQELGLEGIPWSEIDRRLVRRPWGSSQNFIAERGV